MRKLKLFSLFLCLFIGIGQMWGAEETISFASSSTTGTAGQASFVITWSGNTSCTLVQAKGSGNAVGNYTTAPRWYQNNTITITPKSGITISKIVFTGSGSSYNGQTMSFSTGDGTVSGNVTTWTGSISGSTSLEVTPGKQFRTGSVVVTYTTGGSTEPTPSLDHIAITGTPETTSYEQGQSFDPTGLIVTAYYDDNSDEVVTEDVEWSFAPAAFTATGENQSVTATATYNEKTDSKTFNNITVAEHVVTPGTYSSGTMNYEFWGLDAEKTSASANEINYTKKFNDVTVNIQNGAKANAYFKSDHTRVYSDGYTMTFSVPSGYNITAIAFTANGTNWTGTHTASVGKMTDNKNWSGAANSVTITFEGTCQIASVSVTYAAIVPEVTVDPSSLTFTAKQNIAVEGKTFTLTGANLTSGLTLAASEGFTVSPTSLTAEAAMADGGAEVTVIPATPTATTTPVEGTVTISGGGLTDNVVVNLSMAVTPTYLVAIAVNDGDMGTATINGGAGPVYAEYAEDVTLVATANPGYEFVNWTVSTEDIDLGEDAEKANGAVATIGAAGTITANFQAQACTGLAAPVLDEVTTTYQSATIAWEAVANADGYVLNIKKHEGNVSVVTDELIVAPTVSFEKTGLAANTQYDYSVMAVGDGTDYCDESNPLLEGSFTTNDYPSVTVTYSENGNEVSGGNKQIMSAFALPTEVSHSCAKTFVGWTTKSDFADGDESLPSYYEKGAEFTIESNAAVTLYAVYADVTGGGASTTNIAHTSASTTNMSGSNDAATYFGLNGEEWSVIGYKGGGSNYPGLNKDGTVRLYYNATGNSYIDITAPTTITSVGVTCKTGNDNIIVKVGDATIALDEDVYPINAATFRIINGYTESNQVHIQKIAVNFTTPGTLSNYSITCAAAPVATPSPAALNDVAVAGASGTITMTYEHVNASGVAVSLWNNAACTEAFEDSWLTASLDGDKNITYTIEENTSYNDARSAYIRLIAPETSGAASPAVVKIPVSQVKKAAVFASLEELAAADVNANTEVTVSFSDVVIKEIYMYNSNRRGLTFNIQKAGQDIKIYYNADVPSTWVAGGKVSGTLTNCLWKIYSEAWQLAPSSWAWDNLTYTAPPAIESIEIRDNATKKTYIDGQVFDHTGLTVWAIYSDTHEEEVTALATWTYNPAKLSEGDTEVEVTAEYNSKSDTKPINGLTVNPIPDKTIAEFIAAGGTRCYLEGTVGTIDNTKYGNFDLTDASGTIYVYGCLNQAGVAQKFDELGVQNGDKIKVIAEDYDYFNSKHEAKNVVFVSKVSPVQITIADKNLEVGHSWTIEATTDPAAAVDNISYSIKDDGSDSYVSLAGNVITANAVGTATIIASIPAGEGYLANSIEFAVEVVEAGSIANVVILAKYDGQWYALMNEYYGSTTNSLNALAVDYNEAEGVLLDVAQPSAITWTRSITAGKATFQNGTNYIAGVTGKTDLTLSESASEWTIDGSGHYMMGGRTFLYNDGGYFKNYNAGTNAGAAHYSDYPVVLANPQFLSRDVIRGGLSAGKWGTLCPKQTVENVEGATFYQISYLEEQGGLPYNVVFDEIEGTTLTAGKPYFFIAEGTEIRGIKSGDAVTSGSSVNGFYGYISSTDESMELTNWHTDYDGTADYNTFVIYNNSVFRINQGGTMLKSERCYININDMEPTRTPSPASPVRRRIVMGVQNTNTTTGMDELNASEAPRKMIIDGKMYIFRGEKMYDAKGQLVK